VVPTRKYPRIVPEQILLELVETMLEEFEETMLEEFEETMLDEEGSLAGRETSPMATPAAGKAIGTPASRRANVPPQTEAMEEEPGMGQNNI
jgi:hypothetical protein